MPFIPAPETAKVIVKQFLHGQTIHNTFHVFHTGGWSEAQLEEVANIFITSWNDDIAPMLSDQLTFVSVMARDMSTEEAAGVEISFPALSGGNIVNASMPGNVALACKLLTGLTGRARRGRIYLAGIPESSAEQNYILEAQRALIEAGLETLRTTLEAASYNLAVASYYDGFDLVEKGDGQILKVPKPRASALVTIARNWTVEGNLDSQRRRLTGRGV